MYIDLRSLYVLCYTFYFYYDDAAAQQDDQTAGGAADRVYLGSVYHHGAGPFHGVEL